MTTTAQDATKLRRVEAFAAAVAACFPALHQLRSRLADAAALVAQVGRQRKEGHRLLAALWDDEVVLGVAG